MPGDMGKTPWPRSTRCWRKPSKGKRRISRHRGRQPPKNKKKERKDPPTPPKKSIRPYARNMAFRVEYSAEAEADLEGILEWLISQHAGQTGLRWVAGWEEG